MSFITHDFYCLNCGRRGIPIQRSLNHLKGKNHRKKLYCMYCKTEVNHIEITTPAELTKFQNDFKSGVYEDEAKASIDTCRRTRKW